MDDDDSSKETEEDDADATRASRKTERENRLDIFRDIFVFIVCMPLACSSLFEGINRV
jgi:hypothetical protein